MAISPKVFKQMSKLIAGKMSAGGYDVRVAKSDEEIAEAQKLRYQVLLKESGGTLNAQLMESKREEDEWDGLAYHVVAIDRKNDDRVVGTVRLVSNEHFLPRQRFYTEHAFDLSALLKHYKKPLELSRACVASDARGGAILMLLWKFTMQMIEEHQFDVMFGCASFKGTDYLQHGEILSYLYHKHLASTELMPEVRPEVNSVAIEDFQEVPQKGRDRGNVPTLLRGYLKIGAKISDHAVIDPLFNTTFVAIYVDAAKMFNVHHVLVNKSLHT